MDRLSLSSTLKHPSFCNRRCKSLKEIEAKSFERQNKIKLHTKNLYYCLKSLVSHCRHRFLFLSFCIMESVAGAGSSSNIAFLGTSKCNKLLFVISIFGGCSLIDIYPSRGIKKEEINPQSMTLQYLAPPHKMYMCLIWSIFVCICCLQWLNCWPRKMTRVEEEKLSER